MAYGGGGTGTGENLNGKKIKKRKLTQETFCSPLLTNSSRKKKRAKVANKCKTSHVATIVAATTTTTTTTTGDNKNSTNVDSPKNSSPSNSPKNMETTNVPIRNRPSKKLSACITKNLVEDMTNYISAVEDSATPNVNVTSSIKNIKQNIIECLDADGTSDEKSSNSDIINSLMVKNAMHRKKTIASVVKKVINNMDYEVLLDPDFKRNPFMQNISIMEHVFKNNYKDGKFYKNSFTNMEIPEIGVRYISSQLREMNPENKYEKYCKRSHMKRKSIGAIDTPMNNGITENKCWAYNAFGITLKSFILPLEKIMGAEHRPCLACLFSMYTNIFIDNSILNAHAFNLMQLFSVRTNQFDGYDKKYIISQGAIPNFRGHMKFHDKTHYVLDKEKFKISSGDWLHGLSEISKIHFRQ